MNNSYIDCNRSGIHTSSSSIKHNMFPELNSIALAIFGPRSFILVSKNLMFVSFGIGQSTWKSVITMISNNSFLIVWSISEDSAKFNRSDESQI